MTAAHIAVAVDVDTKVEVDVQEFATRRLAFVYLHSADRAVTVAFRGTPEAMIAAFDQIRDQLVKAVGEAGPVEKAHRVVPVRGDATEDAVREAISVWSAWYPAATTDHDEDMRRFSGGHCTACGLQANRCECDSTPGGRAAQLLRNVETSLAKARAAKTDRNGEGAA